MSARLHAGVVGFFLGVIVTVGLVTVLALLTDPIAETTYQGP